MKKYLIEHIITLSLAIWMRTIPITRSMFTSIKNWFQWVQSPKMEISIWFLQLPHRGSTGCDGERGRRHGSKQFAGHTSPAADYASHIGSFLCYRKKELFRFLMHGRHYWRLRGIVPSIRFSNRDFQIKRRVLISSSASPSVLNVGAGFVCVVKIKILAAFGFQHASRINATKASRWGQSCGLPTQWNNCRSTTGPASVPSHLLRRIRNINKQEKKCVGSKMKIHQNIQVVPGRAGGGSFRGKKYMPIECAQCSRPVRCPNHFFAVNEPSTGPWWWCDLFWCHEVGCGVRWSNVAGCEVTWGWVMWLVATCHVMWCDVMWCRVVSWSCHLMYCDSLCCVMSRDAMRCNVMCSHVMSCHLLCSAMVWNVMSLWCDWFWSHVVWFEVVMWWCGDPKNYSVHKRTTVLQNSTLYYKVLLRTTV